MGFDADLTPRYDLVMGYYDDPTPRHALAMGYDFRPGTVIRYNSSSAQFEVNAYWEHTDTGGPNMNAPKAVGDDYYICIDTPLASGSYDFRPGTVIRYNSSGAQFGIDAYEEESASDGPMPQASI